MSRKNNRKMWVEEIACNSWNNKGVWHLGIVFSQPFASLFFPIHTFTLWTFIFPFGVTLLILYFHFPQYLHDNIDNWQNHFEYFSHCLLTLISFGTCRYPEIYASWSLLAYWITLFFYICSFQHFRINIFILSLIKSTKSSKFMFKIFVQCAKEQSESNNALQFVLHISDTIVLWILTPEPLALIFWLLAWVFEDLCGSGGLWFSQWINLY